MQRIRFGIIGAGEIGRLTGRDLARHPAAAIEGVADVSGERAGVLAAMLGAPSTYTDAADLVRSDEIDAVYIAVPNAQHTSVACAALEAGKHVLLEKPFAVNLAAAQKIADTAAKQDRLLMVGMNQRFERNVQRARLLASAGTFGDVYHVKAFWRRRQGIPRIGSWFTSKAASGGGALLDIGVHVLDVALHVLGNYRAETVSAATFTRFGNRGIGEFEWGRSERVFEGFDVEDFATAMIRLQGGAAVTLEAAWAMHQPQHNDHDVVLFGELAGMSVYNDELFLNDPEGGYRIVQQAPTPPLPAPHCSRAHHFVNVLLGDEQPLVSVDEALAVQQILDAIYESAASGREVVL